MVPACLARVLPGALVLFSLGAGACTKSEAQLRDDDRPAVEAIVADDVRASKAMGAADAKARAGDLIGALDAVEKDARPAIENGLGHAATATPRTPWGKAKMEVFARILADRKAELGPYTEALRSGDAERLVGAIEAQAKIERRAIAAIADVKEGR